MWIFNRYLCRRRRRLGTDRGIKVRPSPFELTACRGKRGNPVESKGKIDLTACLAHLRSLQERTYQARERQRQALLRTVRAAVRSILPCFPGVRRAYLFGSVVRPGAMRPTSDIDIAIEGSLNAEEYFALWRRLEQAVAGWPIELVELDKDLHFATRVFEKGELIYERSDSDAEGGHQG